MLCTVENYVRQRYNSLLLQKHRLHVPVECFNLVYYNPYRRDQEESVVRFFTDGAEFFKRGCTIRMSATEFSEKYPPSGSLRTSSSGGGAKVVDDYIQRAIDLESGKEVSPIEPVVVNIAQCGN